MNLEKYDYCVIFAGRADTVRRWAVAAPSAHIETDIGRLVATIGAMADRGRAVRAAGGRRETAALVIERGITVNVAYIRDRLGQYDIDVVVAPAP